MKEESAIGAGAAASSGATRDTSSSRSRRAGRPSSESATDGTSARFFLSKDSGRTNGTPVLDRELKSESEAMIESLKTGKTYFVISEWRGAADLSKKVPQIRRESVTAGGS